MERGEVSHSTAHPLNRPSTHSTAHLPTNLLTYLALAERLVQPRAHIAHRPLLALFLHRYAAYTTRLCRLAAVPTAFAARRCLLGCSCDLRWLASLLQRRGDGVLLFEYGLQLGI